MNLVSSIFTPYSHCIETVKFYCRRISIRVTESEIRDELLSHPEYPSLLSISDFLSSQKIENIAFHAKVKDLLELPLPFIANTKSKSHDLFIVVLEIDETTIKYFSPETRKIVSKSLTEFSLTFNDIVLVGEATEESGDKNYAQKRSLEIIYFFLSAISLISIPILTFLACLIISNSNNSVWPILFTVSTFVGCCISLVMLWHDIDDSNPLLAKFCKIGKKGNCSSILNSKGSKFFGIKLTILSATYFWGTLIVLLSTGIDNTSTLFLTAILNLFSLLFLAYSILYQIFVAKKWCLLCLLTGAVLMLQFGISINAGILLLPSFESLIALSVSFSLSFSIMFWVIPLIIKAKDRNEILRALKKLKRDPIIFSSLLAAQKDIGNSAAGLGITIGNLSSGVTITKVCNPYCGPCASAHPIIEELLENNENLKVQIVFLTGDGKTDMRVSPVKHLLAIAKKSDQPIIKMALSDWYFSEEKDYGEFSKKYIGYDTSSLEIQDEVDKMNKWCTEFEIQFTPTIFINGKQLPDTYNISDLRNFVY